MREPEASLNDDDRALEASLRELTPAPPRLNRDRLMFLAGQAAAQASQAPSRKTAAWAWPSATAAMTALSLALAIMLATRPEPAPRIVYIDRPAPSSPAAAAEVADETPAEAAPATATREAEPPAPSRRPELPDPHYLRQRDLALAQGVEALPEAPFWSGRLETAALPQRKLLETMLPSRADASSSSVSARLFSWPLFPSVEDKL